MTSSNNQPTRPLIISIDGTAGAGKTTVGQLLAQHLNLPYLDTGAMYRAVTLQALWENLTFVPIDSTRLVKIASQLDFHSRDASPEEARDGRQYTAILQNRDVSQQLRSVEVEQWVSQVAAVPAVRTELVERQRQIAYANQGIVMIGRDIGSVVLPNASLKIFLDASPEVRAQRRQQQTDTGDRTNPRNNTEARQIVEAIMKRDEIDRRRTTAPLVVPHGALHITTDDHSPEEVLETILKNLPDVV